MITIDLFRNEDRFEAFAAGDVIFREGEDGHLMYVVLEGRVSLQVNGVQVEELEAGGMFGEMALVEGHRAADVWADTAVQCIELPLERFYGFRELHPQVGERIMRNLAGLLARRLGRANSRIDMLSAN